MQSILPNHFAVQSEYTAGLHIAIIMDGNGRWATRRGLPRIAGHRAGAAAVRRIVERAPDIGIRRLTLYAFSSDNWRRPSTEVQAIFWLLRAFLRLERQRLRREGVRLTVIGRRDRLPNMLLREIEQAESSTAACRRLDLRVAIDYSSRDAIARAAFEAVTTLPHAASPSAEQLQHILAHALTVDGETGSGEPIGSGPMNGNVDLLIRTGGEKRLSDFLLWESAYAELLFTERMWPDFDADDLDAALAEFTRRDRRFGSVTEVQGPSTESMAGGAR